MGLGVTEEGRTLTHKQTHTPSCSDAFSNSPSSENTHAPTHTSNDLHAHTVNNARTHLRFLVFQPEKAKLLKNLSDIPIRRHLLLSLFSTVYSKHAVW